MNVMRVHVWLVQQAIGVEAWLSSVGAGTFVSDDSAGSFAQSVILPATPTLVTY